MKKRAAAALGVLLVSSAALAQSPPKIMTSVPAQSMTVTNWYKQNVYDASDRKIGEVMDVLLSRDGRVSAVIVAVGVFLGMGEKDVAVPFSAIKHIRKKGKNYLTLDTTKDALKSGAALRYDRSTVSWVRDNT